VLAEPVQTVMRLHGVPEPYEKLKALTRGQGIDRERIRDFIESLDIPRPTATACWMTPASYIGNAADMARAIRKFTHEAGSTASSHSMPSRFLADYWQQRPCLIGAGSSRAAAR
jgi:hypothetical protein